VYHRAERDDGPTSDKTLFVSYDGEELAEGDAVAEDDVAALLMASYGWPAGTTMGEDGLAVWPEDED
jgi:hypothetical protein